MKIGEMFAEVYRFLIPVYAISWATGNIRIFVVEWMQSRQWRRLVPASVPVAVALLLLWSLLAHRLPGRRKTMIDDYRMAASVAAAAGETADYRLNFRRMLEMSGGGPQLRFEFAATLYQLGEKDEALRMMSGLAPLQKGGYEPAHRFLAEHLSAGQSRQIDLLRAVHLGHIIRQNPNSRSERMELVQLLAGYRSYDRAEKLLRPTLDQYPEDSLTIARLKVRTGNIAAARSDARHACEILRAIVAQEPENIPRRIQLAQGYIFLAESGQALDVLCDALPDTIDTSIDSALVDAMSKTYSVWLSLMTERQQTIQRTCLIRLAALPSQAEPAESSERITSAESATPKDAALSDAAFFASVVRSPRRSVVIPFLRGTIAAADGNFSVAEERLRTALSHAADDPSINNNLAWILLQKLNNVSDKDARTAALDEALLLSMHSIESAPSIPEFRETHARILANIGKHELAVNEFRRCLAMGLNNRQIHKSLAASLSILGHAHEAAQHELEAHNSTLE